MTIAELYPVHCDDMNAQHAQMHSMLEELAARVRSSDQAAIEHQLRSFIRYGKMHFADEEQFMKSCEYPKRWDHEQEHSNLVQKLEDILDALTNKMTDMPDDLAEVFWCWFERHTAGSDQEYRDFCLD
jgi:hemerythrin